MHYRDQALSVPCGGSQMIGVLSLPEKPATRGVLIVVGGPQYRAGSHRQFTLLARHLASHGTPTLRFDYRGMGDSEGDVRTFETIDDDLASAVNCFFREVPDLRDVVIWGLCDAASAALFYAHRDARVSGVVLLNPWVRSEASVAKAYLKHYYLKKVFAPELWLKILRGRFNYGESIRSLARFGMGAMRNPATNSHTDQTSPSQATKPIAARMLEGLARFNGNVLLILSGNDLTAKEFTEVTARSRQWETLLSAPRVRRLELPDANHTFSTRMWRDQVARWTSEWVHSW